MSGLEAIAQARADYPAAQRWIYMDVAARGIPSTKSRQAVDWYLDDAMNNGGTKDLWFETLERVRGLFAELIHAQPDEIACTKNVSEGLNAIANAMDWQPGDNVILCPELEHPNNIYVWLNLKRRGVDVRFAPAKDGAMDIDAIVNLMDPRTRLVTAASVTFAPGYRTDIDTLGRICRERDIFLLVDAAQSVGVLHTDVVRSNVDGLSVSTHKGLLGMYGMGFLYCRRAWAERLTPAYLARFSVDLGDAHEAQMGSYEYRLMPGARRFEIGNYNYGAAYAVEASLAAMLELGAEAIEEHVLALTRRLVDGFVELGLPVWGGHRGALANMVTVGTLGAGEHDSTSDPRMHRLFEFLSENGVRTSIRRGLIRFSLHLYNNEADVERILDMTRHHLGGERRVMHG